MISEKRLYDSVLQAVRQQCRLVVDMSRLLKYAQDLPDDPNSLRRFDVQLAKLDKEIAHNQEMKIHLVETIRISILKRRIPGTVRHV